MNTAYVVRFVVIMTALVALSLALLSQTWAEKIKENEAIFNKRSILSAVKEYLGNDADGNPKDPKKLPDDEIIKIFDEQVEQIALDMAGNRLGPEQVQASGYPGGKAENIDMAKEKKKDEAVRILPLYIFNSNEGKFYIVSIRGKGLWDEIWGNIALKSDLNTIVGASFDHKGETPGLGAEIKDNPKFPASFIGKEIYNTDGRLISVAVKKNAGKKNPHAVDAISGATVTSVGVEEMMERGIKYYEPFFNSLKGTK